MLIEYALKTNDYACAHGRYDGPAVLFAVQGTRAPIIFRKWCRPKDRAHERETLNMAILTNGNAACATDL